MFKVIILLGLLIASTFFVIDSIYDYNNQKKSIVIQKRNQCSRVGGKLEENNYCVMSGEVKSGEVACQPTPVQYTCAFTRN